MPFLKGPDIYVYSPGISNQDSANTDLKADALILLL